MLQQCWLRKLVRGTFVTYFAAYLHLQVVWGSSLLVSSEQIHSTPVLTGVVLCWQRCLAKVVFIFPTQHSQGSAPHTTRI